MAVQATLGVVIDAIANVHVVRERFIYIPKFKVKKCHLKRWPSSPTDLGVASECICDASANFVKRNYLK